MMLNLRNNGIFMPLHQCLGFPKMILEGDHPDPWIRPWCMAASCTFNLHNECNNNRHQFALKPHRGYI